MGVSDVVAGNITTVYVAVIIAVRACCLITGHVLGGVSMVVVGSAVVGPILALALIWDLAQKTGKIVPRVQEGSRCTGGICWHGVAVRSSADQVRFRVPHNVIISIRI